MGIDTLDVSIQDHLQQGFPVEAVIHVLFDESNPSLTVQIGSLLSTKRRARMMIMLRKNADFFSLVISRHVGDQQKCDRA